jgi:hypothetical protein
LLDTSNEQSAKTNVGGLNDGNQHWRVHGFENDQVMFEAI